MIEKAPLVVTGACHDHRVGSPEKLLNMHIIPFCKKASLGIASGNDDPGLFVIVFAERLLHLAIDTR
jgi:hypothetical protein